MKFIGNINNNFNKELISSINEIDYTIISHIEYNEELTHSDKKIIQILPITNEMDYYHSINIGWKSMIKSAFYDDLEICTSIFLVIPEKHDPKEIANIINNFDKENLIDNIWIYPRPIQNLELRNTKVENLAWQKYQTKKF
jgi:hypothetical protein